MRYLHMVLCILTVTAVNAAELSDTIKGHEMPDVVVTGTRSRTDVRHLSQTVSVVGRDVIERSQQPSLLPVLTE